MEHVTYLCIWETSVDILILFVQRMFCNGEGAKRFMATHSKIGESQYFFFCLVSFFSAYCNCPCLSIQRGGYACVSFWDVKGKTVAVLQKKRTYDSDPWCLKALYWHCMLLGWVASPMYCVDTLAHRPLSNPPVSSPCALASTLLLKHLFTTSIRLAATD